MADELTWDEDGTQATGAPDWAVDDDGDCIECSCADEAPRDPNDPGAYPGPDPYCECLCHG